MRRIKRLYFEIEGEGVDNNYLINVKVVHKVYGEGAINSIDEHYIDVSFENGRESKFSVPSCFDKFLKIVDEDKQQEMKKRVLEWKEANGILEQEIIRQRTMDTQAGIRKRKEEREAKRIQRAKEVAKRNQMFNNRTT